MFQDPNEPRASLSEWARFEFRVNKGFLLVVSRRATEKELVTLRNLYNQMRKYFHDNPSAIADMFAQDSVKPSNPEKMAAFIQIARVLLNLHETITRS